MKSRYNINRIRAIQDGLGNVFSKPKEVSSVAIDFFKRILGSEGSFERHTNGVDVWGPELDDDEARNLIKPISSEEIFRAMTDIGNDKAPGPDGFNAFFFKSTWHITGECVTNAIKDFFSKPYLPRKVNATILALVPKVDNPSSFGDFRPISCCNVIYKCITKIIAFRLRDCLPKLVDDAQSAFLPGRKISDNIMLARELLLGYHKGNRPKLALKVDLIKAYNSVDWEFLWDVLHARGFPIVFIAWIKACVTKPFFSININGTLEGFFEGKRGLRQGDPLSPYLFTLCLDVLSKRLNEACREGDFKFHWRCKRTELTHLCFADDLMLFSHGDVKSAKILADVLRGFSRVSGMEVSIEKSHIFLSGVDDTVREEIEELFGFKRGVLPIRYLGVPLISKGLKANDCKVLEDRILKRVKSWSSKLLSYAGRVTLIKSVLMSMQTFWCSHFVLPKRVCLNIEKIIRKFLWSGNEMNPNRASVAWEDLCLPKEEGGLGIKRMQDWNIALMGKHI